MTPELLDLHHRCLRWISVAVEQAQNLADYGTTDPSGGRGRQQYPINHPLFPI
jgi:hypothetical protein